MTTTGIQDVHCDLRGDRVAVRAPYDNGNGPFLAKQVSDSARWNKAAKAWTYPLDIEICRALRRVYGERLTIGPALTEWARDYVTREKELPTLASAQDADVTCLPDVAPRLAATLRPYQRVGVAFVREGARPGEGVLLADEPRTGKTLQAIAGILDRGALANGIHLVVCPALSVTNVWQREIQRWTDVPVYVAVGSKEERQAAIQAATSADEPVRFLVVNHRMIGWKMVCEMAGCRGVDKPEHDAGHKTHEEMDYPELFAQAWASIVIDESHKVFGSLRVNKGNMMGNGAKRLLLAQHGIRLAVTGTPFGKGGRVMGMFGTLHWLRPKQYTSFWRWADKFLQVDEDDRGHKKVGGLKRGTTEQHFYTALGTVILRRTRDEVMPWLEPKVYEDVYVDMVAKQATQYGKMLRDAAVDGLSADGVLAEMTRLRQFANAWHDLTGIKPQPTDTSGKLPALLERLDEHGILDGSSGEKALAFTQYEAWVGVVAAVLEKEMGAGSVVVITGKTSTKARTAAIQAFQADDGPRVCLMTTQTGGVSITLDRADSVHMLDELWNPEDNQQAEDRAVDTTAKAKPKQLAVYYYRSNDTIESYVRDTVGDKAAEQHLVLDGRRGLEYARHVKGQAA